MNLKLEGVNGQIEITDKYVSIKRKGILSFMTQGLKGEKRIPIKNIKAVQLKQGTNMLNGYIQFSVLGGIESKHGILDATHDENTVMFKKKDNKTAEKIRDLVEDRIFESEVNIKSGNGEDMVAEILKLKKLLDDGIITEEEFETGKNKLLS